MTKRLRILSKDELDFLYALPKFNNDERAFYFDLNQEEVEEINCLRTLESRVHFVLQLGYFKAKFTFFSFSFSQVMEDVLYVLNRYFTNLPLSEKMISQRACFKNNTRILDLVSWNSFDQTSNDGRHLKVSPDDTEFVSVFGGDFWSNFLRFSPPFYAPNFQIWPPHFLSVRRLFFPLQGDLYLKHFYVLFLPFGSCNFRYSIPESQHDE